MAQAVEYKTLYKKLGTTSDVIVDVLPSDLVEVIGHNRYGNSDLLELKIVFKDDSTMWNYLKNGSNNTNKITDIKGVILNSDGSFLTIKITHAEELTQVGPTSVLVIPENSTGNYDVVVESSGDMTTWSPFVSQTVQSDAAKNFFRVRIVKK